MKEDLKINARRTIKFCKTTRWKVADNFGFPGSFLSTPLKNGRVTVVGGTKKGRVKPLLYKIFDASHGELPAWQSLITFRWQILRVLIHHIIPRVCSRPLPSVPFFPSLRLLRSRPHLPLPPYIREGDWIAESTSP